MGIQTSRSCPEALLLWRGSRDAWSYPAGAVLQPPGVQTFPRPQVVAGVKAQGKL